MKPKYYHTPSNIEEIVDIVDYCNINKHKLKVIGKGSFGYAVLV